MLRRCSVGLLTFLALGCAGSGSESDAMVSSNLPALGGQAGGPAGAAGASGGAAPTPANVTEGNGGTQSIAPSASPPAGIGADAGEPAGTLAPLCPRSVTDANKATVSAAIDELFVQGDIGAVDRYWGEPYLQHNPIAASGVTAFRNLFSGLISPGSSIYELSRVIGECELVLIQGDYTSFGGPTFDLFRVQGGRLVEHWDSTASAAGPNSSGHTALDGPSSVVDLELTGQNKALVRALYDDVLLAAAYDSLGRYVSESLIEHDPESSDGAAAYAQHLQSRAVSYREIHHTIADGNFVFVFSEGAVGATPVAHYDLFRVESSLIVEHWYGRRDVPATTQSGLGIF